MSNHDEILASFRKIFAGAQDKFVLHVPPFQEDKNGKVTASFVGFAKYGSKSFKQVPTGFDSGDYVPCSVDQYRKHLNGDCGLAISPLIQSVTLSKGEQKNVCAYGVIDIDVPRYDYTHLVRRLSNDGWRFVSCRSKSGGLHIYFIFEVYEPAKDVRRVLSDVVRLYGLDKKFSSNGVSKVEIFPEHDERKDGLNEKGVLLPYFNAISNSPNALLTAEGKFLSIEKALDFAKSRLTSVKAMDEVISRLPYTDAPYCVQAILLSGALWSGEHRNDFLFTVALYLKQKHGSDFLTVGMLEEANERLEHPLEKEDLAQIVASAKTNDYPILGQCKKSPMVQWCDKALCRKQEFSAVKRETGNVASNIQFGQMWRVRSELPYYLLEAKLAEDEGGEFTVLHIDAAENLLNQKTVQKECIDKLGQVMWTVKQQVWEERLNAIMQTLENMDVSQETDTTDLSDLRGLFNRYLTHGQVQSKNPFRITLKQVYYEGGKYYFQTDGFKDYLRISRYTIGRTNLREQLISYGCEEGEVEYERRDGTRNAIKCWVKEEDALLKTMTVYYEDMVDQDAIILEQNKLDKDNDRAVLADEDVRF